MELKTLQTEVDNQLNELKRARLDVERIKKEVQELLAQKEAIEAENILILSKMYEKMDPAKAASILVTLDKDLAVDILTNMKKKSGGKILNNMDAETAAGLSVEFSKLDEPAKSPKRK